MNVNKHIYKSESFKGIIQDAIAFYNNTPTHKFPINEFQGTGVYGLYYYGDFPQYIPLSEKNIKEASIPIYIGKAVPSGWRTGRKIISSSNELYRRIKEHMRSIANSKNLNIQDFYYKFVILTETVSDLIVPFEAELIRRYQPLWNTVIDGFGNHDPGKGRYYQAISEWDTLHPGRHWVKKLKGEGKSIDTIKSEIGQYFQDKL